MVFKQRLITKLNKLTTLERRDVPPGDRGKLAQGSGKRVAMGAGAEAVFIWSECHTALYIPLAISIRYCEH